MPNQNNPRSPKSLWAPIADFGKKIAAYLDDAAPEPRKPSPDTTNNPVVEESPGITQWDANMPFTPDDPGLKTILNDCTVELIKSDSKQGRLIIAFTPAAISYLNGVEHPAGLTEFVEVDIPLENINELTARIYDFITAYEESGEPVIYIGRKFKEPGIAISALNPADWVPLPRQLPTHS